MKVKVLIDTTPVDGNAAVAVDAATSVDVYATTSVAVVAATSVVADVLFFFIDFSNLAAASLAALSKVRLTISLTD